METAPGPSSCRWIPWSILAFFVFFIALLSGFAWIAIHTYTGEITPDAYKKGLVYNKAITHADEQNALNWTGAQQVLYSAGKAEVVFTLKDASGRVIKDASVVAHFIRPTQSGHDRNIELRYENGVYKGEALLPLKGVWEMHISATRATDNYQLSKTIILQ